MRNIIPLVLLLTWSLDYSTGRLLRVVTTPVEPYFQPTSNEPEGFLVDLMQDLVDRLNVGTNEEVTYRFYRSPDGKYGYPIQGGQWSGMIGELIKGEADLAAAPLTINKERNQVVLFSHPFMSFSVVPLVKRPAPGVPLPFNSLTDLQAKVQAGNLTIGYVQHGSTENYMSGHKLPIVRALYNLSKAANAPSPYAESIEAGIQRVRNDPKFIFFGENTSHYRAVLQQPCDLAVAWSAMIGEGFFGFAFPKTASGRQWTDRFNEAIISAQQDGTVEALVRRWWSEKATCPMPQFCICRDGTN